MFYFKFLKLFIYMYTIGSFCITRWAVEMHIVNISLSLGEFYIIVSFSNLFRIFVADNPFSGIFDQG